MTTFDEMLEQLHSSATLTDSEKSGAIEINTKREFVVPEGYNLVLAYEGDINSQVVTFNIPKKHEGHDLAACGYKRLRWNNPSANTEGVSELTLTNNADPMILTWTVPPEAFVKAGILEISIIFYDFDKQQNLAFAWNTPVFKGFSVGETTQSVGIDLSTPVAEVPTRKSPAKNEILFVDVENRNIVAPVGYNFVIGSYGDVGTSTVHFQMQRYVHGMDLLSSNTKIFVKCIINNLSQQEEIKVVNRYSAEGSYGEGLVNFDWLVSDEILNHNFFGNFAIAIIVTEDQNKRWNSAPFNSLQIGQSIWSGNNYAPTPIPYILSGNEISEAVSFQQIPGLVSLRDNSGDIQPIKNELIIDYQEGDIYGIEVGYVDPETEQIKTKYVGHSQEHLEHIIKEYLVNNTLVLDANRIVLEPLSYIEVEPQYYDGFDFEWDVDEEGLYTFNFHRDSAEEISFIFTIVPKKEQLKLGTKYEVTFTTSASYGISLNNSGDVFHILSFVYDSDFQENFGEVYFSGENTAFVDTDFWIKFKMIPLN